MDREIFIKKLHPALTHIRASEEMSEERLQAIWFAVEKVMDMRNEQLKAAIEEGKLLQRQKYCRHLTTIKKLKFFHRTEICIVCGKELNKPFKSIT